VPDNANIFLNVYDGKRQLLDKTVKWSVQASDGRDLDSRKTLLFPDLQGGSQALNVPFFDNFADSYTIIVNADGFQDGAWYPVVVNDRAPVTCDILLLPKNGSFHFDGATWDKLSAARPNVAKMIRACSATPESAAAMYTQGFEARPKSIACFLNLVTAMADMQFPSGKSPLDYRRETPLPTPGPSSSTT
jgi:hypothetical protein